MYDKYKLSLFRDKCTALEGQLRVWEKLRKYCDIQIEDVRREKQRALDKMYAIQDSECPEGWDGIK